MSENKKIMDSIFVPERHLVDQDRIEMSPSGQYRLVIKTYTTATEARSNTWNYTQGCLLRMEDNILIKTVERNYSTFNHAFVQKGDQEYLITGRSYTGLTIVECTSGREWNLKPTKYSLCSTSWTLSSDGRTLIVCGCGWGGPYFYWFLDFNVDKFDPEAGLPSLDVDFSNVSTPANQAFLDGDADVILMKGSEVPEEVRGDTLLHPEGDYIILQHKKKYNFGIGCYQDDLWVPDQDWKKVLPVEHHPDVDNFIEQWEKPEVSTTGYVEAACVLKRKHKECLKKDCVLINDLIVILQRKEDRMICLRYEQFDPNAKI